MENNAVALAAIGVLGSCIACMVWVIRKVLGEIAPALVNHSRAADGITQAIKDQSSVSADQVKSNQYVASSLIKRSDSDKAMTDAIERMAAATETSAREARERNGHLAEISIQNKDAILKAIRTLNMNQEVKEQNVEHQVVNNKE